MTSQIENENAAVNTSADEQSDIKTPDILNLDYRYLRLLGEGANGRTWLARDRRVGLDVAIKELKFAEDFKAYELFQREAEVLQSVRVEGVPHFIKSVNAPDMTSYIVQEYIPYPSLESRLEKGEIFDEEEVYTILELTSRILFALQTQYIPAIIHRDIKPGNILYCPATPTEDAKVWLIDFGAVDNAHKQSSGSTIAGTFGYMSPEQLQGEVSPRSDFYSLGATALHLLTGVFPYEIPVDLFQMKFHPVIEEKAPKTTKPMVDFLDMLLARNAEDRPQSIKELRMLLNEAMSASEKFREIKVDFEPVVDEPTTKLGRKFRATKVGQWFLRRKIAKLRKKFEKDIQRQIDNLEKAISEDKKQREAEEKELQKEREKNGIECRCEVRRVSVAGNVRIESKRKFAFDSDISSLNNLEREANFDESLLEGLFTHDGNWYAAYIRISECGDKCRICCTLDAPAGRKVRENEFTVLFIPSKHDIQKQPKQTIWLTEEFYTQFTGQKPLCRMTDEEKYLASHPEEVRRMAEEKKAAEEAEKAAEKAAEMKEIERRRQEYLSRYRERMNAGGKDGNNGNGGSYFEQLQRLNDIREKLKNRQ